MNLKIPIAFFDIESTGINTSKDRILELYIARKNPDGTIDEFYSRFNPLIEIPESASKVHNIYAEDIIGEPLFKEKADEILEFINGCDLSGYNIMSFDIPMLFEEFIRAGKIFNYRKHRILDSYKMWTHFEPRTLTGATRRFLGRELENAHRAKGDVMASMEIFFNQCEEWSLSDLDEINQIVTNPDKRVDLAGKFIKNEEGEIVISFGKHAYKKVNQLFLEDPEYLRWMYEKADMPYETKMIAKKIYENLSGKLKNK